MVERQSAAPKKDVYSVGNRLDYGAPVEFRVNGMGKQTFAATLVAVDQSVDATDYSIKVYARVKEAIPDFRPGMYVRARLK